MSRREPFSDGDIDRERSLEEVNLGVPFLRTEFEGQAYSDYEGGAYLVDVLGNVWHIGRRSWRDARELVKAKAPRGTGPRRISELTALVYLRKLTLWARDHGAMA